MSRHLAIALLAVLLTAGAQVLLKVGATSAAGKHPLRMYLNPYSLTAYATLFGVTLLTLYAYAVLPIKTFIFLQPLNYILVATLSIWLLKERITRRQLIGYATILVGIVVYYS